jgi:tetratricopeptide (TPR) repeat protein
VGSSHGRIGFALLLWLGCNQSPDQQSPDQQSPDQQSPQPRQGAQSQSQSQQPALVANAVLPAQPAPEVLFAGCERVLTGPRCELLPGSALTLWSSVTFDGLRVLIDGQGVWVEDRVVADGYQATLPLTAQAQVLELRRAETPLLRLSLGPVPPDAALDEARRARDTGDYPRALELAAEVAAHGSALSALLARGIEARVLLRTGRVEQAAELLGQTTPQLFELGQLSEASRDLFAHVYILLYRLHRIDTAQSLLSTYRARAASYPLGRMLADEHEGMLRSSTGQMSDALRAYALAERGFERLGQSVDARRVQQNRIGILSDMGQIARAYELHARLLPPPADEHPCTKAELYIKQSWLGLLRAEDGELEDPAIIPAAFAEAERWLTPCGDPELHVSQLVNRGLYALERADLAAARIASQALAALPGRSAYLEGWALELRGRIALGERRLDTAYAAFQEQHALGRASASLDARLRALSGLAEVAQARGRDEQAMRHLEEALTLLEQAQRLAPLGPLGHSHYAARRKAAESLVELLVARGKSQRAFEVALSAYGAAVSSQARSRDLEQMDGAAAAQIRASLGEYRRRRAQLDAALQTDWQVTSRERKVRQAARGAELAELNRLLDETSRVLASGGPRTAPAPQPGEYWLLFFPVREQWLVFGNDGSRITVQRHGPIADDAADDMGDDTARATHPLLAPFRAELLRARRIVLLPAGAARHFRFESWPLDGAPLGARGLVFSAGLPGAASNTPEKPGAATPSRAGAIIDPRGDLPFARKEGALIRAALGLRADQLLEGERATPASVLALFETADHVHFAGHARGPDEPGGAALLLGRGGAVEAWEFFGLSRVPRQVVLSACSSGVGDRDSFGAGWNLAQALLGAGAQWVVGPSGVIADETALAVQGRLYRELQKTASLPDAFWNAQQGQGQSDGAVFRLFRR